MRVLVHTLVLARQFDFLSLFFFTFKKIRYFGWKGNLQTK